MDLSGPLSFMILQVGLFGMLLATMKPLLAPWLFFGKTMRSVGFELTLLGRIFPALVPIVSIVLILLIDVPRFVASFEWWERSWITLVIVAILLGLEWALLRIALKVPRIRDRLTWIPPARTS